jgi:hypothetical protein
MINTISFTKSPLTPALSLKGRGGEAIALLISPARGEGDKTAY